MITLNQISDLFIKDLEGGNQSNDGRLKLDRRDVVRKARIFAATAIKATFYEKMNEGDRSGIELCIATYNDIALQEKYGFKYIAIPEFYMSLPYGKGVHRVYVQGNDKNDFVFQHNPGISSNLPHMQLKDIQYCYISGMEIRMSKGCTVKKADKMALELIVPAPDSIGADDPLPLSPEHVSEVMRLLKVDYLPVAGIPNDTLNNANPNLR